MLYYYKNREKLCNNRKLNNVLILFLYILFLLARVIKLLFLVINMFLTDKKINFIMKCIHFLSI